MVRVITKRVVIEDEEFVLIQDDSADGKKYFGTISYKELDHGGKVKRALNGFDMCISFESIGAAIDRRLRTIKLERYVEQRVKDGISLQDAIVEFYIK